MKRLPPSSLRSGLYAFGIYIAVVGLLLFYFNSREENKSKRYVKKDEHRIQVALSGSSKPQTQKQKKPSKAKPKPTQTKKSPKKAVKKKVVKKQVSKKQVSKKRVIKEKVVKKKPAHKKVKKKDVNKSKKPKKRAAKDLFANVKTTKKKKMNIQVSDKPISATAHINNSLKNQKSMQSGVESNYLATVQSMLEDWPAQHDYAGEKVKVLLYIDPTGNFEFKIKSASRNLDFNRGLTEYLEQLQEFGFGRHKGGRTYEFEAEFIAKE